MAMYRRRDGQVEAIQFARENFEQVSAFVGPNWTGFEVARAGRKAKFGVKTSDGKDVTAVSGDWIVRDGAGLFVLGPMAFAATYEIASGSPVPEPGGGTAPKAAAVAVGQEGAA